MKNLFFTVILIVCVIFLSNCSAVKFETSTNKDINAFHGQPISTALAKWGPADRTSDDGKGGLIYTWDRTGATTTSYSNIDHSKTTFTYHCTRNLFVDQNGIIYHGIFEGQCD